MDQSILSGIGNYLRADIMYYAKVSPHTLVENIKEEKLTKLTKACRRVPLRSYKNRATTCGSYDSYIHIGSHTPKVYGRTEVDGERVETFQDKNKRMVWWVPSVQNP